MIPGPVEQHECDFYRGYCVVCDAVEIRTMAEALWGDDWDFAGAGMDWTDRANERGWCWRDEEALWREYYASSERLAELLFRSSPMMAALTAVRPDPVDSVAGPPLSCGAPVPASIRPATTSEA